MAIDGRGIGKAPREKDSYESPAVRIIGGAIVWVPVALVVVFAYWSGTWFGGWVGGVLGLGSAILTVLVLWILRSRRKR